MKKQLTMSLETAREIYKDLMNSCGAANRSLMNFIEENFTQEELETGIESVKERPKITIEDLYVTIKNDNSVSANITTTDVSKLKSYNSLDEYKKAQEAEKSLLSDEGQFVRKKMTFVDEQEAKCAEQFKKDSNKQERIFWGADSASDFGFAVGINLSSDSPHLTLAEAKTLYNFVKNKKYTVGYEKSLKEIMDLVTKHYTIEQLEGKKGFTWEDSFDGKGFWISGSDSSIRCIDTSVIADEHKNVFKTKERAESSLAFAQLSHIVDKYNEGNYATTENGITVNYYIQAYNNNDLKVVKTTYFAMVLPKQVFLFNRKEDAETSLEVNKSLWEQFWMNSK